VTLDEWIDLERPDGRIRAGTPRTVVLGPGETLTLAARIRIPARAPTGTYTVHAQVGDFPTAKDSDTFTFVKE
jgi:hypothetical protein